MRGIWTLTLVGVLASSAALFAKDNTELKDVLDDKTSDLWIYEDIAAGYAASEKTGKPLLVSFRCVP